MHRLALILFLMIGTTLAGIGIVVALVLGLDTLTPVVTAALAGFFVAVPVTVVIARQLTSAR